MGERGVHARKTTRHKLEAHGSKKGVLDFRYMCSISSSLEGFTPTAKFHRDIDSKPLVVNKSLMPARNQP